MGRKSRAKYICHNLPQGMIAMLHIIAKLKKVGGAVVCIGSETSGSPKLNEQNSALSGRSR